MAHQQQAKHNLDLICCDCLLVIKTNVFSERKGKMATVFANLIEGCFSGFESVPLAADFRAHLKQRFFRTVNRVEVHCDNDFAPLTPEKVVWLLVQTLAKQKHDCFNRIPLCLQVCILMSLKLSK